MGLFEGKQGVVLGVANDRSIAWAIAQQIMDGGGTVGFSHLPDKPDDPKKKNRHRVTRCTDAYGDQVKFVQPLDVQDDAQVAEFAAMTKREFGKIDFLLHSIAFADLEDLRGDTIQTSRNGFKLAMDVSVYSLISACEAMRPLFNRNAAVAAMTYYGGEKCVPGYNVMGICKAALDATVRYLAFDLGGDAVRVNAISAGPLKTLAGSAAKVGDMMPLYQSMAPLDRRDDEAIRKSGVITHEEVGRAGAYLLSEMSSGVTAEILHVDAGYNAMGSPGRLLDEITAAKKAAAKG